MKEIKTKTQVESGLVTVFTEGDQITTVYVSSPYKQKDTGFYNVIGGIIEDLEKIRDYIENDK